MSERIHGNQLNVKLEGTYLFDTVAFMTEVEAFAKENGMTMSQVGKELALSASTLSELCSGRLKYPSIVVMAALAGWTGINPGRFLIDLRTEEAQKAARFHLPNTLRAAHDVIIKLKAQLEARS